MKLDILKTIFIFTDMILLHGDLGAIGALGGGILLMMVVSAVALLPLGIAIYFFTRRHTPGFPTWKKVFYSIVFPLSAILLAGEAWLLWMIFS